MLALAVACGRPPQPSARLRARVVRPPPAKDTLRFEAPASAHRCGALPPGPAGLVLQGARGGNGVLVWLRFADSLAPGDWPLLQRADTAARRGAVAGVRFMVGDVAHGAPLDSGGVSVTRAGRLISVRVRGSGREVAGAEWVGVEASFEAVPLGTDTVSCLARP